VRELRGRRRVSALPVAFTAAWAISVLYLTRSLNSGWFPHDDGSLAQSAERVLDGQLPHRDFDDIYTGGLDYAHALAFEVLGHELTSLRLVLFAFFVAWVPALYAIARRFAAPVPSAALVLLCVVWSVPNYSASMPSWYNLFLATFALAALYRFLETRRRTFLALAGLACGVSIVVKVTGVYALAAIVLALLLVEQEDAPATDGGATLGAYGGVLLAALALVVTALFGVIEPRLAPSEALDFFVPGAAICAFLGWNEVTRRRGASRPRFARAFHLLLPVAAGASLPIAAFAVPYLLTGSLGDLATGVLVEPAARLEFATVPSLPLQSARDALVAVVPLALAAALTWRRGNATAALALGLVLLPWLVLVDREVALDHVLTAVRWAARLFVPVAVVVLAARWRSGDRPPGLRVKSYAALAMAAWTALIQFPFSAPIYFSYAVPFFFVAVVAFERRRRSTGQRPLRPVYSIAIAGFLLAVGVFSLNALSVSGRPGVTQPSVPRTGGLRLPAETRAAYSEIVRLIDRHSAPGDLLYAGPDAPEVYFLSGRPNRTPFLFEFLADDTEVARSLGTLLTDRRLTVAVVNTEPDFSPSLDDGLARLLERRLPNSERVGPFEVRWSA
jgi:hypothetical protein